MSIRFRYSVVFLPAAAALAAIVACGDDADDADDTSSTPDASVRETSTLTDAMPAGEPDTGIADAGRDADAALPDLCALYPNAVTPGDASVDEPPNYKRYELISYRSLVGAMSTCEVGSLFASIGEVPPDEIDCFANELAALAKCSSPGGPAIVYKTSGDRQGQPCSPDSGISALLGLHLPPGDPAFTLNDVDFIIDRARAAAIETGLSAADADRLRDLLRADRAVIVPNPPATDAGYSQSECK